MLRVAFFFFFFSFSVIDRFLISSNKVRKGGHTPRRDAIVLGSAFLWLALLARINREATGSLASQLSATTLWPINSFIGVTKQECPVNRSAVVLESETWPKLAKIPKPKFVSLSLMPRVRVYSRLREKRDDDISGEIIFSKYLFDILSNVILPSFVHCVARVSPSKSCRWPKNGVTLSTAAGSLASLLFSG